MMSLQTIEDLQTEAATLAAESGTNPKYFWDEDIATLKAGNLDRLRSIPNIGSHRPDGFELVQEYFVDKSGFGREDEPALTIGQLVEKIKPEFGYAIVSEGQFQIYIGEFKRI